MGQLNGRDLINPSFVDCYSICVFVVVCSYMSNDDEADVTATATELYSAR